MSEHANANRRLATAIKRDAGVRVHLKSNGPEHIAKHNAMSYPPGHVIVAPEGYTDEGLAALAHEAGHVATQPPEHPGDVPPAEMAVWEFLATQWGIEAIRRHGGTVTQAMQEDSRNALWTYIAYRVKRSELPAEIVDFLEGSDL